MSNRLETEYYSDEERNTNDENYAVDGIREINEYYPSNGGRDINEYYPTDQVYGNEYKPVNQTKERSKY